MRTLLVTLALTAIAALAAPALRAQHSPTVASGSEIGAEITFSDNLTTFAGIYQVPIGPRTDVRAGFGIADPEGGDSEILLTGGIRGLLSRGTSRFPLAVALEGQIDLILVDDTFVGISAGPSFGNTVGPAQALLLYGQPLLLYTANGDSEADFGVRLGADYAITPTVDVRGDVLIADDTALRAALYFQF